MRANEIVDDIQQIAQLSVDDVDYTATAILREVTQAQIEKFARPLHNLRMGYWLQRVVQACTVNQAFYRMPHRSVVHGLSKLEFSSDGLSWSELSILTDSQSTDYDSTSSGGGQPGHFSLVSDGVFLYPPPNTSGWYLRFSYLVRPPTLVPDVTGGRVVTVTPLALQVQVDSIPAGLGTVTGADIQHTNGSFEYAGVSLSISGIGGVIVTFAAGTDLSRVVVGDVLRIPEQSDYPMLPVELHRAICDYSASTILASKGDFDKAKIFAGKGETGITSFVDMATPRVKDRPYVFKTRNTFLRKRVGSWGWR